MELESLSFHCLPPAPPRPIHTAKLSNQSPDVRKEVLQHCVGGYEVTLGPKELGRAAI
jgi:hypothetical protein